MINVSREFKQHMAEDDRNFLAYLDIVLRDGTQLERLDNSDLWENGFKIDDGVTPSNQFTVGSCIVNKLTVTLDNIYDKFSPYDFDGAVITAYLGLDLGDDRIEKIQKGVFIVDEPQYDGTTITLECLDNMSRFDVDYSHVKTSYPATLGEIVNDICNYCGVGFAAANFENHSYVVSGRPDDDALSCRQVLVYCAQIACCFGRCDRYGRLKFKWFEQGIFEQNENLDGGVFDDTPPYDSGGWLDGGDFDDYSSGDFYDGGGFSDNSSEDIADGGNFEDYSSGTTIDGGGFDNVPFHYDSGDIADGGDFVDYAGGPVSDGGSFDDLNRFHHLYSLNGFNVSTDDVAITGIQVTEEFTETEQDKKQTELVGSKGYVLDVSGNKFIQKGTAKKAAQLIGRKLIGLKFRPMSTQTLGDPTIEAGDIAYVTDQRSNTYNCLITNLSFNLGGLANISCDAETPGKNSSKQYSELTQSVVEIRKEAQKQASSLATVMSQAFGVFKTEEAQEDGSIIYYMHDKPTLAESKSIWKFTADAFAVSTDGGRTWNAGLDADGNATVNILSAIGINCDWIHSGTLTLGGYKNVNGRLVMLDSNGAEIGRWDVSGLDVKKGKITGVSLTLGGNDNQNGRLVMLGSNGAEIGRWDNNGIFTTGKIVSDAPGTNFRAVINDGKYQTHDGNGNSCGSFGNWWSYDDNGNQTDSGCGISAKYGKNNPAVYVMLRGNVGMRGDDVRVISTGYAGVSGDDVRVEANDQASLNGDAVFINGGSYVSIHAGVFSVSNGAGWRKGRTGRAEFSDGSYLEYLNGVLVGGSTTGGGAF